MKVTRLSAVTRRFYTSVLTELGQGGIEFLVGGGHALESYLGIGRSVKDLDLFIRERDVSAALALVEQRLGYGTELTFPHWLAKIKRDEREHIDVIFNSGNAVCPVDDECFQHAVPTTVMGLPVRLYPAEEMIWSKAFVMERERYDGADICHLILACHHRLDWPRLLARFGSHWRVLLSHLTLFGFIYPGERHHVPAAVMLELLRRLDAETRVPSPRLRVCRGTLLSREQYLVDVSGWGYADGRLGPSGTMTPEEVTQWTAAIRDPGDRECE